ncbi:MAG: prepilin peptidase [Clostridia bacterium]|nr:prepilin peptidase [Clostridia bacterium]
MLNLFAVMMLVLMMVAGAWDLVTRQVPDLISYSIVVVGFVYGCLALPWPLWLGGGVAAFLFLGIPAMLGKGMGGADVKIGVGLGFFFGFPEVLGVLCLSFVLCLIVWLFRRRNPTIPLVPYMLLAGVVYGCGI